MLALARARDNTKQKSGSPPSTLPSNGRRGVPSGFVRISTWHPAGPLPSSLHTSVPAARECQKDKHKYCTNECNRSGRISVPLSCLVAILYRDLHMAGQRSRTILVYSCGMAMRSSNAMPASWNAENMNAARSLVLSYQCLCKMTTNVIKVRL